MVLPVRTPSMSYRGDDHVLPINLFYYQWRLFPNPQHPVRAHTFIVQARKRYFSQTVQRPFQAWRAWTHEKKMYARAVSRYTVAPTLHKPIPTQKPQMLHPHSILQSFFQNWRQWVQQAKIYARAVYRYTTPIVVRHPLLNKVKMHCDRQRLRHFFHKWHRSMQREKAAKQYKRAVYRYLAPEAAQKYLRMHGFR